MNSNSVACDQLGAHFGMKHKIMNMIRILCMTHQKIFEDIRVKMRGQTFSLRSGRWIFQLCNELTTCPGVPQLLPLGCLGQASGMKTFGFKDDLPLYSTFGSGRWFVGRPRSHLQVLHLRLLPALNKKLFHRSGDWHKRFFLHKLSIRSWRMVWLYRSAPRSLGLRIMQHLAKCEQRILIKTVWNSTCDFYKQNKLSKWALSTGCHTCWYNSAWRCLLAILLISSENFFFIF